MHPRPRVLVLIDSDKGTTLGLAKALMTGIVQSGCDAELKRVHPMEPGDSARDIESVAVLERAALLTEFDGIAFGSPVHFGNMSSAMRRFLDTTVPLWTEGKLVGKPATVFMGAGTGAGHEAAILSFWNTLAVHGMIIVPVGIVGADHIEKRIGQSNSAFGAGSAAGMPGAERPSAGEREIARLQGAALARAAKALAGTHDGPPPTIEPSFREDVFMPIEERLEALGLTLPKAPQPVGNYKSWRRSGSLIFINQIALVNDKVPLPGRIGETVSEDQCREAVRITLLNCLAVLKEAVVDLRRVKGIIQLTGFFCTVADYKDHANMLDEASRILVGIWGEAGMHARAAVGAYTLPMASPCELQLVAEESTHV